MAWDGQFEVVCSLGPEEPKSCVGPGLLRLLNRSMAGEDSTPPSSIPVRIYSNPIMSFSVPQHAIVGPEALVSEKARSDSLSNR